VLRLGGIRKASGAPERDALGVLLLVLLLLIDGVIDNGGARVEGCLADNGRVKPLTEVVAGLKLFIKVGVEIGGRCD
jgi:hypothetical protein